MNARTWILRNGQVVANLIEWLANDLPTDDTYQVTVKPHKSSRNLEQNAYLWQLLTVIADHCGHTKDELYDYYIDEFAPVEVKEVFGEAKAIRTTSSKMNVGQMAAFITRIEAHAADMGIRLASRVA